VTTSTAVSAPWYGVLQPRAERLGTLTPAGLGRATLEIGWDNYEPTQGAFNPRYKAEVRARYQAMRAAGLEVVLDAGLQYPPAWVFGIPGGNRFVNQYGDVWRAGIGSDVPDVVFNLAVRRAEAAYLTRLARDLADLPMAAVRVGGMWAGELHFPPSSYNGHTNSFWAYGASAQASSPVRGYRPGQADSATAGSFLSWYLGSLAGYGRWLAGTYRTAFGPGPRLQVLEPSWGVRPGEITLAAGGLLKGGSRGEQRGTLNEGLDWSRQAQRLVSVPGVELYSTWLDAPDQGTDSVYESPVRYLVRVARPLGISVAGENTGGNTAADMTRCVQRVAALGLTGMMWMREPELTDGVHASLDDYRRLIGA